MPSPSPHRTAPPTTCLKSHRGRNQSQQQSKRGAGTTTERMPTNQLAKQQAARDNRLNINAQASAHTPHAALQQITHTSSTQHTAQEPNKARTQPAVARCFAPRPPAHALCCPAAGATNATAERPSPAPRRLVLLLLLSSWPYRSDRHCEPNSWQTAPRSAKPTRCSQVLSPHRQPRNGLRTRGSNDPKAARKLLQPSADALDSCKRNPNQPRTDSLRRASQPNAESSIKARSAQA